MIEDDDEDDSGSDPESNDTPAADNAFEVDHNLDPTLNDVAMASEMDQHMQLDESMIDPSLIDLADSADVEGLLSPQNITLAGAAAESAAAAAAAAVEAEPVASENTREGGTEEVTGKKRKHREDGEKKSKKRSKKDKEGQSEEHSIASPSSLVGTSNVSTVSSENTEMAADQPAEELTEDERQRLKEEKRKRKEEKRARKEAKRQLAELEQSNSVIPSGDDVANIPE